jgi:pimeloyl-ACP methyl ester carboxylesterase
MADITSNGVRFNVQRLGQGGPCVVFVHGLVMDNLSSWYFTVANRVATETSALLYDLRGHGRSERPASGYTIADMIEDLRGVLDACAVTEPVVLVGNSFGGLLAVAFAAAHPQRCASLALVDPHVSVQGWADEMSATLELEGDERDQVIADNFKSWLGRHSDRKRNRLARAASALVYDTSLVRDIRASASLGPEQLAAIECPVLALYGADSDALGRGVELAQMLPECRLETVPGCTHSVLWEATDLVREHLLRWILEKK